LEAAAHTLEFSWYEMNAKKVTMHDVDNSINELYNKMVNNKPYILKFGNEIKN